MTDKAIPEMTDDELLDMARRGHHDDWYVEAVRAEMDRRHSYRTQKYMLWGTIAAATSAIASMIAAGAATLTTLLK